MSMKILHNVLEPKEIKKDVTETQQKSHIIPDDPKDIQNNKMRTDGSVPDSRECMEKVHVRNQTMEEQEEKGDQTGINKLNHLEKEKSEKRKGHVLMELIDTEKNYVRDLGILVQDYIVAFRKSDVLLKPVITEGFSYIEAIFQLNKLIIREICEEKLGVGRVFMQYAPALKIYSSYCGIYDQMAEAIQNQSIINSNFRKIIQDVQNKDVSRGLDVFSFLIKPVQRICKYPLLLKELLKETDETSREYTELSQAYGFTLENANDVNERVKCIKKNERFVAICASLEGYKGSLLEPSRKYIWECDVKSVDKQGDMKERKCIILNDMILFTKELKSGAYKWKESIMITHEHFARELKDMQGEFAVEIAQNSTASVYSKSQRRGLVVLSSREIQQRLVTEINAAAKRQFDIKIQREMQEEADPTRLKKWKQVSRARMDSTPTRCQEHPAPYPISTRGPIRPVISPRFIPARQSCGNMQ